MSELVSSETKFFLEHDTCDLLEIPTIIKGKVGTLYIYLNIETNSLLSELVPGVVINSINTMSEKYDSMYAILENFYADLSHDLSERFFYFDKDLKREMPLLFVSCVEFEYKDSFGYENNEKCEILRKVTFNASLVVRESFIEDHL